MNRRLLLTACAILAFAAPLSATAAEPASKISADSQAALTRLYSTSEKARQLGAKSVAILVFPKILKAGFVVGGEGGDGALIQHGRVTAYYRTGTASFGFQAGAQTFSYAMFFITPSSLDYLRKSKGWSVGTGPTLVVLDKGGTANVNTSTLSQDVYAIPFGEAGLMGGINLEGSKISQIHPGG